VGTTGSIVTAITGNISGDFERSIDFLEGPADIAAPHFGYFYSF
jgi:hypothetical protein